MTFAAWPSSGDAAAEGAEYLFEHLRRQAARVGVVARAVIAVGEDQAAGEFMQRPVAERPGRALQPQGRNHRVVGEGAERQYRLEARVRGDLGGEVSPAGVDLSGLGPVLRRDAANGVGDAGADQLQPVVGPGAIGALGEAELDQGRIEQPAGEIAGERPAGAVRPRQPRRQPDDQQPRVKSAEGGDRPVVPVGMPGPVDGAIFDQARTVVTISGRVDADFAIGDARGWDRTVPGAALTRFR